MDNYCGNPAPGQGYSALGAPSSGLWESGLDQGLGVSKYLLPDTDHFGLAHLYPTDD